MYPFKTIRFNKDAGIYRLTLNRPEVKNALSKLMISEMTEAVMDAAEDSNARVLLIDHEGDVFCAGADMADLIRLNNREDGLQYARLLFDLLNSIEKSPIPVVLSARGNVFGGGIGILAAADVSFLDETCRLCFSEVKIGMVPAVVSSFVLKKIPSGIARELMLTAREFTAHEAQSYGLISFALPADLLEKQLKIAIQTLLSNKKKALAVCKEMIFTSSRIAWHGAIREYTTELFADLLFNEETREAMQAFLQRKNINNTDKDKNDRTK